MNIIVEKSKSVVLELSILKSHLRIEHEHEDTYLEEIIEMATEIFENSIEKPIMQKKYKYICFNNELVASKKIVPPLRAIKEIISVKKLPPNGTSLQIPYSLQNYGDRLIVIISGSSYPVEIVYIAGITDNPKEVPKDLQFAILQIAKNIYECSEENILESNYIKRIIDLHRTVSLN
jgi:uncharacterized phiE125 gp8 family phage protein